MRKIVQQMLRGEPVVFEQKIMETFEQDKRKRDELLQRFQKMMDEKDFESLQYLLGGEEKFYSQTSEDMYAEGLRIGILLGLETANVFDIDHSILYKIFYTDQMSCERNCLSADLDLKKYRYYDKAVFHFQDNISTKEYTDLELTNMSLYIEKETAHYMTGIRKGIILGVEAGNLLCCKDKEE